MKFVHGHKSPKTKALCNAMAQRGHHVTVIAVDDVAVDGWSYHTLERVDDVAVRYPDVKIISESVRYTKLTVVLDEDATSISTNARWVLPRLSDVAIPMRSANVGEPVATAENTLGFKVVDPVDLDAMAAAKVLVINSDVDYDIISRAFSVGCPVMAAADSRLRAMITHGVDGWLIEPHEFDAALESIGLLDMTKAIRDNSQPSIAERWEHYLTDRPDAIDTLLARVYGGRPHTPSKICRRFVLGNYCSSIPRADGLRLSPFVGMTWDGKPAWRADTTRTIENTWVGVTPRADGSLTFGSGYITQVFSLADYCVQAGVSTIETIDIGVHNYPEDLTEEDMMIRELDLIKPRTLRFERAVRYPDGFIRKGYSKISPTVFIDKSQRITVNVALAVKNRERVLATISGLIRDVDLVDHDAHRTVSCQPTADGQPIALDVRLWPRALTPEILTRGGTVAPERANVLGRFIGGSLSSSIDPPEAVRKGTKLFSKVCDLTRLTPVYLEIAREGLTTLMYKDIDVLIYAGEATDGPLSLLEAALSGIPVISRNIGYAADLSTIKTFDTPEEAALVLKEISDDIDGYVTTVRSEILEKYSTEKVTAAWREYLDLE